MSREEFIDKNKHLFWYLKPEKISSISNDVLVEFVFNYGTWQDIKELTQLLSYEELKDVFNNVTERKKGNYSPEMYDLFKRIIEKYAS